MFAPSTESRFLCAYGISCLLGTYLRDPFIKSILSAFKYTLQSDQLGLASCYILIYCMSWKERCGVYLFQEMRYPVAFLKRAFIGGQHFFTITFLLNTIATF